MEASLRQWILPIKLERSSERLSSLGGLVVVEEWARAVGLWEEVDRALKGPKSGRGYPPHEFVQALVWRQHAGGRRREDLRELRAEHEVLGALGLEAVPDAGTVGDWLRRQGRKGAEAIQPISGKLVAPCFEGEEVILEVEATEIEAEKQEAQGTYQHLQGYLPLVGYVDGGCVGHEFREGNQSPGAGILEFAKRCEAAPPAGKRIYFRSDSAAYQAAVIDHYSQPRQVLPASYRTATVATLRWKLYRLAGKLVRHARGGMLQIKADLEKWSLLQSARVCWATLRT